jgi:hypothetical protein
MKIAGAALIALSLAVAALWLSHGADLATREKVAVTKKTTDDFGDETEEVVWEDASGYPLTGFHVGLDRAAPLGGGLFVVGAALLFLALRRK